MLFNSVNFAVFLPIVFVVYWIFGRHGAKWQNYILLLASYVFYVSWDYRFLLLLIFSTVLDWWIGKKIQTLQNVQQKKVWLVFALIINLGILGVIKYCNFFISSFIAGLSMVGIHINTWTLLVILPIGISFYTFHGLSYVIDIYKEKIQPEPNLVRYAVFVSFFPLLVAGPIERANHLLPQIQRQRRFDYTAAVDGLRQMLWGLFKKVVIADNCARYVNVIFGHTALVSGSTIAVGAIFFAVQIYCDFSGYSDIAIGTARLFGIDLLRNFAFPYFSRNMTEFWRRWHISLTSWFRDYIYFPLGGSRAGAWCTIRNTLVIFLISGLWHGGNWTFIAWGLLNAVYLMPAIIWRSKKPVTDVVAQGKYLPTITEGFAMLGTFTLTTLAWILFRADSIGDAWQYYRQVFSLSLFTMPTVASKTLMILISGFTLIEWLGREQQYAIAGLNTWPTVLRWVSYIGLTMFIFYFFVFSGPPPQFIYFQF